MDTRSTLCDTDGMDTHCVICHSHNPSADYCATCERDDEMHADEQRMIDRYEAECDAAESRELPEREQGWHDSILAGTSQQKFDRL